MPLQNRVAPGGQIIATSARGTFLGNRGILHDENKQIVRLSKTATWLICRLEFNGRRQELMNPKRYTQLFFLDEAVALAAGHRPCGECRRTNYRAYLDAANVQSEYPIEGAPDLDKRLSASRAEPRAPGVIASLPDGVYIELGENDFRLIWGGALHRWSPEGYVDPIAIADVDVAEAPVVTPRLSIAALRHGYPVTVHPSAAPEVSHGSVLSTAHTPRDDLRNPATNFSEVPVTSGLTPKLRDEVEQILRTSSPGLTHGEVFRYMEQGLNPDEIASSHGTSVSNVQNFMKSLEHLRRGTLPTSKSAARTNSYVYKELLNHDLSPGLLSHLERCLRALIEINPEITMEPLQTRSHQYSTNRTRRKTRRTMQETACPACFLIHPGTCD